MRLWHVTVPVAIVIAGFGGILMVLARDVDPAAPSIASPPLLVRHPVTRRMAEAGERLARRAAPAFTARDTEGNTLSLATLRGRPLFLYFIMDGCPCSLDAEPLFHRLYRQFNGRAAFVGVTDADARKAAKWVADMSVPYPVVSHPSLEIMRLYGARQSVFCVLVAPDGAVVRAWPGYSASMLKEANELIAAKLGEKPRPFDPQYAPPVLAAGCEFGTDPGR